MDYDMKELTEIAEAGSKRIKELEAELRESLLSELAALGQAQEAYEKQRELEAENARLRNLCADAQAEKEAAVAAAYEDAAGLEFGKLGWGRAEKDGMNLQSDTPFGRYYIAARPDSVWLWWRPASGPAHHGNAASEQDAMAQCQQDYEMRLSRAVTIRTDTDALAARDARVKAEALRDAMSKADRCEFVDVDDILALIPDQHKESAND